MADSQLPKPTPPQPAQPPLPRPVPVTPTPAAVSPAPAPVAPQPVQPVPPQAPQTPQPPQTPQTPPVPQAPQVPRPPQVPSPQPVQPPVAMPGRPATPSLPQAPRPMAPAAAGATPPPAKPAPQAAKAPGGSMFKFLPIILGILALVGVAIFAIYRFVLQPSSTPTSPTTNNPGVSAPTKQTVITYWGLWEPSSVLEGVFTDFSKENPGVIVQYQKQSPTQYRERLQSAIASGTGPDVFRFHASWVPMLRSELTSMPSSVMSATEYSATFYPIAVKQLSSGSQIVGVPLMYDGLGLYYNKQIFQTAGMQPPTTWAELSERAQSLTIRNGEQIERSGAALGTATNVEHFSDILGLLMIQNGADPSDPTSNEAIQALTFYTNFATKYNVWDETLPSSTVAFARGDTAMMIAPSWRAHEVLAMNPDLQFGIISVPKLATEQIAWASFWAEGVSSQSKNKDVSWKLLKYLSSATVQQKLYADAAQTRTFGEIYSRKDLADELISDQYVGAYLSDAPYAQTWYLNSYTHDNGLNDQIIKYYEDAISAISNSNKTVASALETVAQGTNLVLRQFGLITTAPVASPSTR